MHRSLALLPFLAIGCSPPEFVFEPGATIITEARGVGFDNAGQGVLGATAGGTCVFTNELGMVGEMDVPGYDRVLDMVGSDALIAGDALYLAHPNSHTYGTVSDLAPVTAQLTDAGWIATYQDAGQCVVRDHGGTIAALPGSCGDLAVNRADATAYVASGDTVVQVAAGHDPITHAIDADQLAFDPDMGRLWAARSGTDTLYTLSSDGDIASGTVSGAIVDIVNAGELWRGALVLVDTGNDSEIQHVVGGFELDYHFDLNRDATGLVGSELGSFVGVTTRSDVQLFNAVVPSFRRDQQRQRGMNALRGAAGGGSVVAYD